MKLFAGILTLALSFATLASSGESKTFTYDGSQNSVELILKGEKTHTEYRYEDRQSICYRTEIVGYRTICTGGGPRPYPGPGPRPYPGPRHCFREPIYRQVSYPCTQTVRVPFEVKDYDVDARVLIDVSNLEGIATTGEQFTATLKGDALKLTAKGSKKFILVLKNQSVRENQVGAVKYMDALYAIDLVEAAPVLKTLKMTKITMKKPVLTFEFGPLAKTANFAYSLKVAKDKTIGSDEIIFNKELAANDLSISTSNTLSSAQVDFDALGIKLSSGKFKITAKAEFRPEGEIMNYSQFNDSLDSSRTLSYKLR